MQITLRQLEYAVAVARLGHFGRAAEACHASQPALSAGISGLETALGVTLFERDRNGVRTTAAGAEILRRATQVLAETEDLVAAARAKREPFAVPFRLGAIPTIAPFVFPRAVPALRANHPKIRLVLREDRTAHLVRAIEGGELDAAVVAAEADLGDCEAIPLYRDPFVVALPASHRLARKVSLRERDLLRERVLLLEEGH